MSKPVISEERQLFIDSVVTPFKKAWDYLQSNPRPSLSDEEKAKRKKARKVSKNARRENRA